MSNKLLTKKEIEMLLKNPYVKSVSEKSITYTDEFKNIFITEYANGMIPSAIFRKYGFNVEALGYERIKTSSYRWRNQVKREDGLCDTRKGKSGRPRTRDLSDSELISRLEHKIAILEQENSYLKKIRLIEKAASRKAQHKKNTN